MALDCYYIALPHVILVFGFLATNLNIDLIQALGMGDMVHMIWLGPWS